VALEICGEQAVEKVRAFVGPFDPEVARHIRPQSLRARFGADKLRNAVHCTDLPEDGVLEAEYVFQILKNAK
jgi:nucleoside-diphosphate kinase